MLKACILAAKRFYAEGYSYRVSSLVYTTLLAIVPLMLVIVSATSIFPVFNKIISLSESYIIRTFVPTSANTLKYYFQGFITQASKLPASSIIFLFITAVMLVNTIVDTLNDIWRAPKKNLNFFSLLVYWLILLIIPVLIGLSALLTSSIVSLSGKVSFLPTIKVNDNILLFLSIPINALLFALFYTFGPNTKVRWRDGLSGGLLAAVFFELARIGFIYYIEQFPSYALIYGAFAVIPIFLVWLYISWFIILFCGLVTYEKANL